MTTDARLLRDLSGLRALRADPWGLEDSALRVYGVNEASVCSHLWYCYSLMFFGPKGVIL
jgi:hypothetical protein